MIFKADGFAAGQDRDNAQTHTLVFDLWRHQQGTNGAAAYLTLLIDQETVQHSGVYVDLASHVSAYIPTDSML